MTIRFREEHLRKFSAASLDRSPMHLSEAYARKSAVGERAVYGVLGVLASLRGVALPPGCVISKVTVQYHSPLLLNVDYSIQVKEQRKDAVTVFVMDGSVMMMQVRLQLRRGLPSLVDLGDSGHGRTSSPALTAADLLPGLAFTGKYSPPRTAYFELLSLLGLKREVFGDPLLILLLISSYLTGMELPGESSLSVDLTAAITESIPRVPLDFEIILRSRDERFRLLRSEFRLFNDITTYATGVIGALSRPARTKPEWAFADATQTFTGKTALLIGASRGLGAAMVLFLVSVGYTVVGVYARSGDDAEALLEACRNRPGRLLLEQGDAADLEWCVALRERVLSDLGGLDLLICNAAPPVTQMRLEEAYFPRIQAYLHSSFGLVGAPLSALLAAVSAASGSALLISSGAVETLPRNCPQYVASKSAAEGLLRAAVAQYPKVTFWIARPGEMRTDLVNTPVGWLKAEEPQIVARRVLEQVIGSSERGGLHFCR